MAAAEELGLVLSCGPIRPRQRLWPAVRCKEQGLRRMCFWRQRQKTSEPDGQSKMRSFAPQSDIVPWRHSDVVSEMVSLVNGFPRGVQALCAGAPDKIGALRDIGLPLLCASAARPSSGGYYAPTWSATSRPGISTILQLALSSADHVSSAQIISRFRQESSPRGGSRSQLLQTEAESYPRWDTRDSLCLQPRHSRCW